MRMRRKKNLEPRTAQCQAAHITEPQALRGQWSGRFGRPAPLWLEIGCGKGRFALQMARKYPQINFVAVERDPSALLLAMEAAVKENLPNLLFLNWDAAQLDQVFAPEEAERVFLNFSDPWPPKNRAKRRLTHRNFLAVYDRFLKPGGAIYMKTDNAKLFEFSLNEFADYGLRLSRITFDLHSLDEFNIMTEYEEKFSSQGMPIYRCVAAKPGPVLAEPQPAEEEAAGQSL